MGNCGAKSKNQQIRFRQQQQMESSGQKEIRLAVLLKNSCYQSSSEDFKDIKSLRSDNQEHQQLIKQLENFGFEIIIYQDFDSFKMQSIQERIQGIIDEKMIKNLNGKIILLTAYQGYAIKKQEEMFGITTDFKAFNLQELEDKIVELADVQQQYQINQDIEQLKRLGVSYAVSQQPDEHIFAKLYQVQESYEEQELQKSRSFIQLDQAKFQTEYKKQSQVQNQNQKNISNQHTNLDKTSNVEPYQIQKIDEDEADLSPKSKVKLKNKQGIKERTQGNYNKAIKYYDQALSIDPKHKFSLNNKGVALKYMKKHEEALLCYDQAIQIDPKYADAYNGKGNALSEMKKYDEAIECFQKAIQNDPNYYYAYNNLGNAYKDIEELEMALECYGKALQINPKYVFAYNGMGIVLRNMGRFDEAIECYDKALNINSKYQKARNNRDILIKRLQEIKQAQ